MKLTKITLIILGIFLFSIPNVQCFGIIRSIKLKFWSLLGLGMDPKKVFQSADAVCFDVDSTLFTTEAIDELAKYLGKLDEVKNVTKQAMSGQKGLREALIERLNIMKPDLKTMQKFIAERPPTFSTGVVDLINRLHKNNVKVYLISGGFDCLILTKAKEINIPEENVFANRLLFDFYGKYVQLDLNQPTSDNFGKAKIISALKEKYNYKTVVMVGDGITDMEACQSADSCIGYGGNVVRPEVEEKADWFVKDFSELTNELKQ